MKFVYILLLVFFEIGSAYGSERQFIVSNGQGVSSPSFSDGLSGENPAGLVWNQSFKLQGNVATFNGFDDPRGSGAILVGNGLLGVGIEYSKIAQAPNGDDEAQINWGIAGRFGSLSLGVSGHHPTGGGDPNFDVGALWQVSSSLRWGFLVPDVTHGIHRLGAGMTYTLSAMLDFVVDAAYHLDLETAIVKPGITIRTQILQLTGAYGFRVVGSGEALLLRDFTGGVGIKLGQNMLLGYEYKGFPEHRLGLTLRLN